MTLSAAVLLAVISGIPLPVSRAMTVFREGDLYLRVIGMEPETDFRRDGETGIPAYSEGCESSAELDLELELWNTTMKKLWDQTNTGETAFTITTGTETLQYENSVLTYSNSGITGSIAIHPEELWAVIHKALEEPDPATGQILLEASLTDSSGTVSVFITSEDHAMRTVQTLLDRGRDSISSLE